MEIRKGRLEEKEKICDAANACFIPYRNESFDFRKRMPKAYDQNHNTSQSHYLALDNDSIIALAGNLVKEVNVNSKVYKYALLGSVGTLNEYSGRGYMKRILAEIDNDNKNNDILFSILTGIRQRYNYYGYQKIGYSFLFTFDEYLIKHSNKNMLIIKPFEHKNLDKIYNIYLQNNYLILRAKDEFEVNLKTSESTIYEIYDESTLIGYFALSDDKTQINEIALLDYELSKKTIISILDYFKFKEINVVVNSLNIKAINSFDAFCERRAIFDEIHIKVYNLEMFLNMCYEINRNIRQFDNIEEVYKVDDEIYKIKVTNGKFSMEKVNESYKTKFTMLEFLRYIFNPQTYIYSKIFPFLFDISYADLF